MLITRPQGTYTIHTLCVLVFVASSHQLLDFTSRCELVSAYFTDPEELGGGPVVDSLHQLDTQPGRKVQNKPLPLL